MSETMNNLLSTTQSQPQINQIATLLIPVSGKLLVLPNVAVAEVIPYREPTREEDVPNWYLGRIEWRAVDVPVVSFEAINDEPFATQSRNRRIAILNNVTGDQNLPFCGIVTEGLPRLMRVMSDEIVEDADAMRGPAETLRVFVSGERAAIPDIAFLQQRILELL